MEKETQSKDFILIPFGINILALSHEDLLKATQLGQAIMGQADTNPPDDSDSKLLDAERASEKTGIPSSWFLEAARQGRIPYIKAGKYVRFRMSDIIKALEIRPGHKASMAFGVKKEAQKQQVIRRATKMLPP